MFLPVFETKLPETSTREIPEVDSDGEGPEIASRVQETS